MVSAGANKQAAYSRFGYGVAAEFQRWPAQNFMNKFQLLLTSLIFAFVGCNSDFKRPEGFSKSLIVLSHARSVKFSKNAGSDQVSYTIKTTYPAKEQISSISVDLVSNGWKPLADDWLNPGIESSHTRGWTNFEDASKKPNTHVFQWLAQWEDKSGNIISYVFQYRYPSDAGQLPTKPRSDDLKVFAAYFPSKLATSMKNWARTAKPPSY